VEPGHFAPRLRLVEAAGLEGFGLGKGLVDHPEDIAAVAFFLQLPAGDFGFDEAGDALGQIGDFVGLRQKFLGDRNSGHAITFSARGDSCKPGGLAECKMGEARRADGDVGVPGGGWSF